MLVSSSPDCVILRLDDNQEQFCPYINFGGSVFNLLALTVLIALSALLFVMVIPTDRRHCSALSLWETVLFILL